MEKTVGEIAVLVGGRAGGDTGRIIKSLAALDEAGVDDLAFAVPPHIDEARACEGRVGALLLPGGTEGFSCAVIYVDDPKAAFAKLLAIFTPAIEHPVGVSDEAYIGAGVRIGAGATVLPFAYVDDNAVIGAGVTLYPHTYVGQYSEIGDGTTLYPNAVVREHCRVGARCTIHSCAVIGADGFGFTTERGVHTKVPQVGGVVIEDDVEIGAHVGIDRATLGATVIGKGTKIDNLVHIGHNCNIGANCLIVAQTGISGSTKVGHNVTFGGQVGTVGHINIGANSVYAARSGIIGDMPEGTFGAGFPVQSHAEWLRVQAAIRRLPEMAKKLKALEKKLSGDA
ncbi:UDP-3-O-[3-hydroxymyristoyl] glucosamine N-acyltransferase [Selenomonas sp. oral taxon 137 str. F0430]|uniref:UDP-3-O-(3-hydroxymyristoyl)glucosamine N-acyltransferase n=1 Tax=Selenomonas sp. oral taxon 137 TaxID=712531 RepID=UPI0001EB27F5|nr:UDP-3-O-(3-hydroxymyristoyl)glucosamine N-acyltransferase [Selenomonas sp. oral taxon 137]EFR41512.1 UDP-3-O-[3-hydroxymyristoyl] glucosamine N-acyltransferase [Selenomonas sp. oral taxon 137 str. F0430]